MGSSNISFFTTSQIFKHKLFHNFAAPAWARKRRTRSFRCKVYFRSFGALHRVERHLSTTEAFQTYVTKCNKKRERRAWQKYKRLIGECYLSDFINLRSAECVCSYYGLRVCSQTNKLNYIALSCAFGKKSRVQTRYFCVKMILVRLRCSLLGQEHNNLIFIFSNTYRNYVVNRT